MDVAADHRRSSVVFLLVVMLLVGATIVAIGAALFILSEQFSSVAAPWVSPLSVVHTGAIDPALALGTLAGQNDADVASQASAAGSLDTALATLLYSTSLDDQTRLAGLLSLGRKLVQSGQRTAALQTAHTSVDIALLSPVTSDHNKVIALDQAGQILASLGKDDAAAHAYSQAALLAQYSGRIDPSYRQLLLQALLTDVARLGRSDLTRSLRAALQSTPPEQDTSPYVLPSLLVSAPHTGAAWDAVEQAAAQRIDLAAALITALEGNAPTPPETIRRSLERALLEESRLREQLYADSLAESTDLLARLALAREQCQWLTLKWRIARQGFGMALVPAWESQTRDIEAALRKAYEDYYVILRDVAVSVPQQRDAAQGAVEAILDQIKLGRLGLPPHAQEGELVRALDRATSELHDLGRGYLYIINKTVKGGSQLTVVRRQ
jgi:hypothetical protein